MQPAVAVAVCAAGLACGSFATVLAARVPRGGNVVHGRSGCPECGAQIAWYDNIPVASWLVLRGRCRSCATRISWSYPAMELAVGLLWLLVYAVYGISWTSAILAYLAVVTVALVAIDLVHKRLPHRIVLPSYGVVGVLMAISWITGERDSWATAAIGLAVMGGFYALLWFIYPRGMGFGDVTTAGLLGVTAGYLGLEVLAVSAIAGPLVGGLTVLILLALRKVQRGEAIPYGPAMIVGAWLGYLWGADIASWYVGVLVP